MYDADDSRCFLVLETQECEQYSIPAAPLLRDEAGC